MLFENYLVYPVPPVDRSDWKPVGLGHEDIWFNSVDGTRLHGWFLPHPAPQRAILYCHGNGEQVADNAQLAAQLRDELRASVFIFDYRGYGQSGGTPSETGLIADGLAAHRWLAERLNLPPGDIVLMGRSLGSAVAVAAAAEQGAQALVLENAFPTLPDVAAYHFPWLPVRWAMDNRYDSASRISGFRGPLFQSHGTHDRVVPYRLGRQLFDACPSRNKQFLDLDGHDHNDAPPDGYFTRIREFLEDSGVKP